MRSRSSRSASASTSWSGCWIRPVAIVASALMVVFIVAQAQAWYRGLVLDCGCFGAISQQKVGLHTILRDAALGLPSLAMAIWPARKLSLDSYWLGRPDRFAIGDVVRRRRLAALLAAACVAAVAAPSALAHGGTRIATIEAGGYVARVDALLVALSPTRTVVDFTTYLRDRRTGAPVSGADVRVTAKTPDGPFGPLRALPSGNTYEVLVPIAQPAAVAADPAPHRRSAGRRATRRSAMRRRRSPPTGASSRSSSSAACSRSSSSSTGSSACGAAGARISPAGAAPPSS